MCPSYEPSALPRLGRKYAHIYMGHCHICTLSTLVASMRTSVRLLSAQLATPLTQRSQHLYTFSTSLHRPRPCLNISSKPLRWQVSLCRPHLACEGSTVLWIQCWIQGLSQGLHAEPYAHDSIRRFTAPGGCLEPH